MCDILIMMIDNPPAMVEQLQATDALVVRN